MKKVYASDSRLKIIIPTYKREDASKHISYNLIPEEFKKDAYFAVREERLQAMKAIFPDAQYLVIPEGKVSCIADTRQWILEHCYFAKQWYFDDDVKLFQKRDEHYRIRGNIGSEDFAELYNLVSEKLDEYAYVGLAPKLFNNLATNQFSENTAIYTCFALRADILRGVGARYDALHRVDDRITIAEDKYMVAYLLSKGYKNVVLNEWVYAQKEEGHVGSDKIELGGCYGQKTKIANDLSTDELSRCFPGCITRKTANVKDDDGNIVDTYQYPVVRWKKVFESAQANLFDME